MTFAGLRRLFWLLACNAVLSGANAASITLQPVADTTLCEFAPNNNLGGNAFFIAGTAGVNASGANFRSLFRFDLSVIPARSKITKASVKLEVAGAPVGGESSSFVLHRMLRSWGEGTKDSTEDPAARGLGYPATTNEATWNSPFAFTTNTWTSPGANGDYASIISANTFVYAEGDFPSFDSTLQMIDDVQTWLDDPATNFGWMLKNELEEVFFTARRFGSREFVGIDTNSPPFVLIEFIPPPIISDPHFQSGQFAFSFLAEMEQEYVVEFNTDLGSTNAWQILTNVSASALPTNIVVSDLISTNAKFYRVAFP